MKHEMTNKEYNEYVKTKTPNSKLFSNCLKAFVSGGIICVIGHFILTMFKNGDLIQKPQALPLQSYWCLPVHCLQDLIFTRKSLNLRVRELLYRLPDLQIPLFPLLLRQKPKVWCSVSVQKFSQSPVPLSFTVHLPRSLPVLCIGL